jgi:hypothetical protein
LTALADAVPSVSGGEYRRTQRSITAAYEQTLFALPLPGQTEPVLAALERTRNEARARFEQAKRTALGSGLDFRPVFPFPLKWYEPEEDVWTKFSSSAVAGGAPSVTTPTAVLSAAAPVKSSTMPKWTWKVLPSAERLRLAQDLSTAKTVVAAPAATASPTPAAAAPKAMMAKLAVASIASASALRANVKESVRADVPLRVFRPDVTIATAPPPQPVGVKPAALEMSFEACVITLTRPWIFWPWIDSRGWYVPGYRSGQLCLEGQPLHRVPVSTILVRNLTLSARGASNDVLKDAVAFGPFQFVDRQVEVKPNGSMFDVSVACPGVQLIAWVTQPLSGLPPKTDPTVPDT